MIDQMVCMTLDKRLHTGELGDAYDRFAALGIPSERLLVGDGLLYDRSSYHWIDVEAQPRRQAFNYASAFLKAVHLAGECEGLETLLYLEDDAALTRHFESQWEKALEELATFAHVFDLCYVGGNHTNGAVRPVSPRLLLTEYSLDLHAVIIHKRAFPKLLKLKASAEHTIDGAMTGLQHDGITTVLAMHPSLAIQRPGFSYCEGRFSDKSNNYWVER